MPYVKAVERALLDRHIDAIVSVSPTGGMLNYTFTRLLRDSLLCGSFRYDDIQTVIGCLECCKLELYRRMAPYEDRKIEENGDVP